MSGRSSKRKKRYVDLPRDRSKLTCLIHGKGIQQSDHCKVINNFGTSYAAGRTFKEIRHELNIRKTEKNKLII